MFEASAQLKFDANMKHKFDYVNTPEHKFILYIIAKKSFKISRGVIRIRKSKDR